MAAKNLNAPENWLAWLRACQKDLECRGCEIRGVPLAMLTGQDMRALGAIAQCWHLYFSGDFQAEDGALAAVRVLLPALQTKCWPFARELVAQAREWHDRQRVWPLVVPFRPDTDRAACPSHPADVVCENCAHRHAAALRHMHGTET